MIIDQDNNFRFDVKDKTSEVRKETRMMYNIITIRRFWLSFFYSNTSTYS